MFLVFLQIAEIYFFALKNNPQTNKDKQKSDVKHSIMLEKLNVDKRFEIVKQHA